MTGLSPRAIRHYESLELIPPATDANGIRRRLPGQALKAGRNLRYFKPDVLERLALIRFLISIGVGLQDIWFILQDLDTSRSLERTLHQHRDKVAEAYERLHQLAMDAHAKALTAAQLLAGANPSNLFNTHNSSAVKQLAALVSSKMLAEVTSASELVADLGLTPDMLAQLYLLIENRFGVQLPTGVRETVRTVGGIEAVIQHLTNQNAEAA